MNFQEAQQKFQILEQKWTAGQINQDAYRAVLMNLGVTDASGQKWMLQEHTGRWFVFRAGQWIEASPPQTAPNPVQLRPAALPRPQPLAPRPTAKARSSGVSLVLILGLIGVCLVVGVVAAGGILVTSGVISLPSAMADWLPQPNSRSQTDDSAVTEIVVKAVETLEVPANGAPQSDSNGVVLVVPPEAVVEGASITLSANTLNAPWRASVESSVSFDTPFYSLTASGKNDSTGSLSLSFPAANPNARLLLVVDNEFLVELPQVPQDGKLTLQTRAAPTDTTELAAPEGYDGSGSIYYAVVTPKSTSHLSDGSSLIGLRRQADERSCIPDISVIGGAAINLCRQNAEGTVMVMLPTLHKDLVPQVDIMVDKIQAVMTQYAGLGFTSAQLTKSSPMLVRVSSKITSPSYYPLNGVLYIPKDSVARISTLSPTDVYHEMAHWIQAVKYSTRLAYYSGERTWWLETSAENMVMLVTPEYVGANLLTYGTISADNSSLALQSEPYQWPGDYYVQAQLLKVNLCDNSACPLSPASFAKAISDGTYPLMDGGAKSKISGNLKDYAYYLLGKSPTTANSAIPLSGPVRTGEGYGEYVRITRNSNVDLKYDTNGADPQIRKETVEGKEALLIQAPLKRDGVYPFMVVGGAGNNPGLPVEMVIEPGAPFYYTLDDGSFQYSDGSQELQLRPIHGTMGIKKVRIVAVGESGGEVFKAKIQPLSLEGAWVVSVSGAKTGGSMTCSGGGEIDTPDGTAQLMAYIMTLMSGTGDMAAEPTGRSLDWSSIPARVPAQIAEAQVTYRATALLAGDGIKYQAGLDIPPAEDTSSLPPALPIAGILAAVSWIWFARRHMNLRFLRILGNLLVVSTVVLLSTGCFGMEMYGTSTLDAKLQKIEYLGGQDTGVLDVSGDMQSPQGTPMWKLTGTGSYDVTFNTETTVTDMDGKDTTEVTVCTGQVTFPVTVYIYKDMQVVMAEE